MTTTLAVGAGALVVLAGGIDPSLAYLLEPQRAAWPGNGVRNLALRVVGRRQMHPDTLRALVRMAHTLHPDDPMWRSVVTRADAVLGIDLSPDTDPLDTLERLDTRAAEVLGKDVAGVGVLAWWPLDPSRSRTTGRFRSTSSRKGSTFGGCFVPFRAGHCLRARAASRRAPWATRSSSGCGTGPSIECHVRMSIRGPGGTTSPGPGACLPLSRDRGRASSWPSPS